MLFDLVAASGSIIKYFYKNGVYYNIFNVCGSGGASSNVTLTNEDDVLTISCFGGSFEGYMYIELPYFDLTPYKKICINRLDSDSILYDIRIEFLNQGNSIIETKYINLYEGRNEIDISNIADNAQVRFIKQTNAGTTTTINITEFYIE